MRASGAGLLATRKVVPAGLVHGHALRDQLVPAEQAVDQLAGVAVLLEAGRVAAATGGRA